MRELTPKVAFHVAKSRHGTKSECSSSLRTVLQSSTFLSLSLEVAEHPLILWLWGRLIARSLCSSRTHPLQLLECLRAALMEVYTAQWVR